MTDSMLSQVQPEPVFFVFEASDTVVYDAMYRWAQAKLTVRYVRGRKMRGIQQLFDEFSAALQFPSYFGENTNAFNECISDLSWLPSGTGYLVIVADPGEVLIDAPDGGLEWLAGSLSRAMRAWATPIAQGEWWDRPAIPFHVVLHCLPGHASDVTRYWRAAGGNVMLIEPT